MKSYYPAIVFFFFLLSDNDKPQIKSLSKGYRKYSIQELTDFFACRDEICVANTQKPNI